jgi:hypothetical protein
MSRGHVRKQGKGHWKLKFDLGRDPPTGMAPKFTGRQINFGTTSAVCEVGSFRTGSRNPTLFQMGSTALARRERPVDASAASK